MSASTRPQAHMEFPSLMHLGSSQNDRVTRDLRFRLRQQCIDANETAVA